MFLSLNFFSSSLVKLVSLYTSHYFIFIIPNYMVLHDGGAEWVPHRLAKQ